MIRRIPFKFAANAMIATLSLVILFHLLILTEFVPYSIVWGGKLDSLSQMRTLEAVSIVTNLLLGLVISVKASYIKIKIASRITNGILWLFIVLFALNTVGNLVAESNIETRIFTPVTFVSAFLCYRLAIEPTPLLAARIS